MLSKVNRLNIRTYFTSIRGTGKKLTSPYFSFYFRLNSTTTSPQVNIVVSKKVAKSAVLRNRMRRLLHTAMREIILDASPELQGIFFVYKDFSGLKSSELQGIIHTMFKQSNLVQK